MAPYIARVKDAALQHALSFGVGYIHEAQPAIERQVVEYLFDAGAIQVCVVDQSRSPAVTSAPRSRAEAAAVA